MDFLFLSCLSLLVATQNAMVVSANHSMDKNARGKVLQIEKEPKVDQFGVHQFTPEQVPEMSEDLQSIVISKQAADSFQTSQKKKSRRRLMSYCNAGQSWENDGGIAYFDKCHNCETGQYQDQNECANSCDTCKSCPAGQYHNDQKQSSCKPCGTGKYKMNKKKQVAKTIAMLAPLSIPIKLHV